MQDNKTTLVWKPWEYYHRQKAQGSVEKLGEERKEEVWDTKKRDEIILKK